MNSGRFVLIFLYSATSIFTVQAQDNNTAVSGNNVIVFTLLGIIAVAVLAFFFWRRVSRELLDESYLTRRTVEMAQIDVDDDPPVIAAIPDIRLPMTRPDDDIRPYLVLELRKSDSSFLPPGQSWTITPDDSPFVIGSRTGANLRIIDEHVSKDHLTINYDSAKKSYILIDKNSSNGSRWDGDAMIKQRPYKMRNHDDVTLEIAVSYVFTVYIDDVVGEEVEAIEESPSDSKLSIQIQLPEQAELPAGSSAQLNWVSPQTNAEEGLQITHVITTIGRTAVAHARINHHLISKLHAYIIWKDNQFWLVDASSNGTWLATGSRSRFRIDYGEYTPLDSDITQFVEIARDILTLKFYYSIVDTARLPGQEAITDKLPELPVGVHSLLHIVRDGENEHRREFRISTSVVTIGQAENNLLRFAPDSLDEDHAKIVWDEGQFWVYDLSGMGTWVDGHSLRRTRVALKKQRIYEIHINYGQSNEIKMEFWYDVQIDEEDIASLKVHHPEHTQKIDRNFS